MPTTPSSLQPTLPREIDEVIGRALAKDPADRPTPSRFLSGLTVHQPPDGDWLPAEATAMVRRVETPPPNTAEVYEAAAAAAVPFDQAAPSRPDPAEPPPSAGSPAPPPETQDHPATVVAQPLPGAFGPPAGGYGPANGSGAGAPGPALAVGPVAEPGAPGGPGRRSGGLVAGAVLVAIAAVAGVLVWQPWAGGSDDASGPTGSNAAAGGVSASVSASTSSSASSSSASGSASPAALPTQPLLIREDTEPGSSTCHSVIAVRDPGQDDPRQLVQDGTCDALPEWSPDHSQFAFTRTVGSQVSVWIANADGSGGRRVGAISGGRVSWSPDGTRLAALRKDAYGVQQLYALRISDGSAQQLTTGSLSADDPAWSPDGTRIAVCLPASQGGLQQIYLVDPSDPSAAPRQVTHGDKRALDPAWSPDGRYFAYTYGKPNAGTQGDIHLIRTDGTDDHALAATAAEEMDPTWSPDGSWVAYVRGPIPSPAVWAIRADGTGARKLTAGSNLEGHPSWR